MPIFTIETNKISKASIMIEANANDVGQIDTNLYSRQIGAFGLETMGKLIQLNVLIIGLRGAGIEV